MSWWRRWWRRRALKRLLPGYKPADGYNDLIVAVPVPDAMLTGAADDFRKRADLANYAGQVAFNRATTAVRAALPFKLPHAERRAFTRESWVA